MKTKLYIVSAVIFAAIGLSLFLSPSAHAAPICGDTDFIGPCTPNVPVCDDKGFIGPCAPIDYAKINCNSYKNSYEGPSRCRAIQKCITERGVTSAVCLQEWNTCRDAKANAQGKMKSTDREGCITAVQTGTPATAPATGENKTSCAVEGIGWIICPVMRFLAQVVDQAYNGVSLLLSVPAIDTSTDSPMYKAWAVMRNFANVAFVMSFLIIIYSQITGAGINNYGIKKMLPRLILAAVLVNVSYWVCAVAVDISNILGVSFKGLLEGTANQLYTPGPGGATSGAGGKWDGLTVGLLGLAGAAAALYVGLSALLPMLIAAAFAIVSVIIILTLRQALIIILIVVSPLAFVAYLLPNTESIFGKWRGTFQALLLMYPILGIIFGGSALASTIITNAAGGNFVLQVMGAGVTIIPLFLAPFIIKAGNAALGRVGIRLNDPTKGPVDRLKRGAEGYRDYRQNIAKDRRFGRSRGEGVTGSLARKVGPEGSRRQRTASWIAGSGVTAGKNKEIRRQGAEDSARAAAQSYVANRAATDDAYAQNIAGPTGDVSKVRAAAISAQVKEFNEKVGAEKATMSRSDATELKTIMRDTKSSEERRSAAAGQLMKVGGDDDIHEALDYVGTQAKDANGNFQDSAVSSIQQQMASDLGSRKPLALGSSDVASLNKGNYDGDFDSKIKSRLSAGKISAEALASASNDELIKINDYVRANGAALKADPATAQALAALETDIAEFRTNPQLAGRQPAHEVASKMDELHGLL